MSEKYEFEFSESTKSWRVFGPRISIFLPDERKAKSQAIALNTAHAQGFAAGREEAAAMEARYIEYFRQMIELEGTSGQLLFEADLLVKAYDKRKLGG